jgi:hypothetical protein
MFSLKGRFPAERPDLATLVGHWDKFVVGGRDVRFGRVEPLPEGSYPPVGKEKW